MDTKENTKKKTEFEIERIYIGKKPMEEVFENIIEHILGQDNLLKAKKTRISDLKLDYGLFKYNYFKLVMYRIILF